MNACLRRYLGATASAALLLAPGVARAALQASPARVVLSNPESSEQLLITDIAGTRRLDRTRAAKYSSANPTIAKIDDRGIVTPVKDGKTMLTVVDGKAKLSVPVEVRGVTKPVPLNFEEEVIPILTKAGCNMGGCHGKAEGQNGFKLSVFGFDPELDFQSLTMEGRGRRVSTAKPDESLLLLKGTAKLPHGGGKRLEPGSLHYRRLARWLKEGAQFGAGAPARLTGIEVEPAQQTLAPKSSQQLRVIAVDATGKRFPVTAEAEFSTNAAVIAGADGDGLVQAGAVPGEAAILVRYMGQVAVSRITIPRSGVKFARPTESSFIDRLAWDKLQKLGIPPSGPCDDATFLRRAFLDVTGTLPTAAEAAAFLAQCEVERKANHGDAETRREAVPAGSKSKIKSKTGTPILQDSITPAFKARSALVEELLKRPEYADYWTMRWSDLLRVDKDAILPEGAVAMTRWLRQQLAENRPYDQIARDILTAEGDAQAEGPAAFYLAFDKPDVTSRSVSQLFLGVRLECAQCHHHPSEKWGQDDYWAFAGFFTGIGKKKLPSGAQAVFSRGGKNLDNPRSKKEMPARGLGAVPAAFGPGADRRAVLADWMTAPDNPFFAKAIANRLWAHYFGRGLVEPLDDMRATNPAVNEPLLDALAVHLKELKYDLRAFTRTLLTSRLYQLSSRPNPQNVTDEQNFSHMAEKAMPAEVLLDAICQVTGVPEKFMGWPLGHRAIQIWDNRMPSYFFQIFGRPVRASVCECERGNEPSIAQALHLMNSPEITDKLRHREGSARKLAESDKKPEAIVDELFLSTVGRYPTVAEKKPVLAEFSSAQDRRAAVEDLLWGLLNTKEFLYNH